MNLDSLSGEAKGWLARATQARAVGRWSEAESHFRRVLALEPSFWPARNELGNLLLNLDRPEEAEREFSHVREVAPSYAPGWCNWGNALVALEKRSEALKAYQQALSLQPDLAAARYNLGMAQLAQANLTEGFENYEARWLSEMASAKRDLASALWQGEPLQRGDRLFVYAEQGLGDTLQFARYVRQLHAEGVVIDFEVQAPLVRLMKASLPGVTVVARGGSVPVTSWQVPLLSLPRAFVRSGRGLPVDVPYLHADEAARIRWVPRLSGSKRRVGLVWSGNLRHVRGLNRTVGAAVFTQTVGGPTRPDLELLGLVKEVRPQDVGPSRPWVNLGPELADFADTAAVIERLDLVITVDTSVAHLAGALGKPVWIWLPYAADWRWFEKRTDSPFYPTARLFRQERPRDWQAAMVAMKAAWAAWLG